MNYFLQGFGVFLGVIAGVVITLITQFLTDKVKESQKVKNLRFEIELNIKKINKWLEEITSYRNAVNGDALNNYFGYFDLGRFVSITANDMFLTGLLYEYLDHDSIGKLQIIYSEFSPAWEDILYKQIMHNKMKATDISNWPRLKSEVVSDVDYWEKKFKEHRATLQETLKKFK
jgi:hypothetical protein